MLFLINQVLFKIISCYIFNIKESSGSFDIYFFIRNIIFIIIFIIYKSFFSKFFTGLSLILYGLIYNNYYIYLIKHIFINK